MFENSTKIRLLKAYTYSIVFIGIVNALILDDKYSIYIPIILAINGQLFLFLSFILQYKIGQEVKNNYPIFFEKYRNNFGISPISKEYILVCNYFNDDLNTLSPILIKKINFLNHLIKSGFFLLIFSVSTIILIILL